MKWNVIFDRDKTFCSKIFEDKLTNKNKYENNMIFFILFFSSFLELALKTVLSLKKLSISHVKVILPLILFEWDILTIKIFRFH